MDNKNSVMINDRNALPTELTYIQCLLELWIKLCNQNIHQHKIEDKTVPGKGGKHENKNGQKQKGPTPHMHYSWLYSPEKPT